MTCLDFQLFIVQIWLHKSYDAAHFLQVVYILDQVKALEEELLLRIKQHGVAVKPNIPVVIDSQDHGD